MHIERCGLRASEEWGLERVTPLRASASVKDLKSIKLGLHSWVFPTVGLTYFGPFQASLLCFYLRCDYVCPFIQLAKGLDIQPPATFDLLWNTTSREYHLVVVAVAVLVMTSS